MYGDQVLETPKSALLAKVRQLKDEGYRLVQICAIDNGQTTLLYSFAQQGGMTNLEVALAAGESVDSIGDFYPYAFLYENEIADLFGVNVTGMKVDFRGTLYQTSVKAPFQTENSKDEDVGSDG